MHVPAKSMKNERLVGRLCAGGRPGPWTPCQIGLERLGPDFVAWSWYSLIRSHKPSHGGFRTTVHLFTELCT